MSQVVNITAHKVFNIMETMSEPVSEPTLDTCCVQGCTKKAWYNIKGKLVMMDGGELVYCNTHRYENIRSK